MYFSKTQMQKLKAICLKQKVKELYVFGSAVTGRLTESSDIDFLVVFDRKETKGAFDQFMDLKLSLESLFKRNVDLMTLRKFRNPYFQKSVEQTKELIYAAQS